MLLVNSNQSIFLEIINNLKNIHNFLYGTVKLESTCAVFRIFNITTPCFFKLVIENGEYNVCFSKNSKDLDLIKFSYLIPFKKISEIENNLGITLKTFSTIP